MCKRVIGVSQELGRSCRFRSKESGLMGVAGRRANDPWLATRALGVAESEDSGAAAVPPSEGNEVRWEDRQEVLVLS